jgi:hypothetical protein
MKRSLALLGLAYLQPGSLINAGGKEVAEVSWGYDIHNLESFSDKFVKPAMNALAIKIDEDIMNLYMEGAV